MRIPSIFRVVSLAALACSALVACDKKSQTSNSSGAPSASVTASVAALRSSAGDPTAPLPENPRDLGLLFSTEFAARPTGTIRTEDAYAAFKRDGIELTGVRQHLGRPYGARYCVGGTSVGLVAVSVCEYIDPAAAKAGAEASRKIQLPNREITINKATSLTVRDLVKTPEADALAKRLFDSFAKL